MSAKLETLRRYKKDYSRFLKEWCEQNRILISSLETKSRDELLSLLIEKTIFLEIKGLLQQETHTLFESQKEHIELLHELRKASVKEAHSALDEEKAIKRETLARGRQKGLEERKHKAKRNRQILTKAILDLYSNGNGRIMTNSEIADFLSIRNLTDPPYAKSTLLGLIKPIVSGIKKAEQHKSGLTNS